MDNLPAEFGHRFVVVLNKKIETGKLMQAIGHMTAGLVGGSENPMEEYAFLRYEDRDGQAHQNMSHFNFVVLAADNSNQIYSLRKACQAQGIRFTDFVETMTIGTTVAQMAATRETSEADLVYYGLCMFGETERLKALTKKFSLFR